MLSDCSNLRFRNLNSTVPVDVVRVKSYVNSLYNSTRVPVRVSVKKLTFIPERIMPGLTGGVFRNGRSLSPWKPYIPIVLLNPFMRAPFPFPFRRCIPALPHSQGILYTTPSCFRGSTGSLGRTYRCDLSVVWDLKTDHTPCRCWQRRSGSDKPLMYGRTAVD